MAALGLRIIYRRDHGFGQYSQKSHKLADEDSSSDHNYIEFTIENVAPSTKKERISRHLRNIDPRKLEHAISRRTNGLAIGDTANDGAVALNRALTAVLDEVAPKKRITTKRRSVY